MTKVNGTNLDVILDVPARFMWGWADGKRGYCGETSFQSHGILYGNWISQQIVRDNADKRELLINVNDVNAAKGLKFNYESFPTDSNAQQGSQFVEWCRTQIDKGYVVVAGFFDKQLVDPDYDHIMPVIGYKKESTGKTLGLFYNDLW